MDNFLDGSGHLRGQGFTRQSCPHPPHMGQCPVCGENWHLRTIGKPIVYRRLPSKRPIPPAVLAQLDGLLGQAAQSMRDGQEPPILSPMMWDAILILRYTGIRCSQLLSLQAPSQTGQGCLERDANDFWWLLVKPKGRETGENDYRVPIGPGSSVVVEALQRQHQRVRDVPDLLGESYLFRHNKGPLTSTAIRGALRRLAVYLTHEGQPYVITPHQFQRSFARGMLEHGGDLAILATQLGHRSLSSVEYYIHSWREGHLREYDSLREKFLKLLQEKEQPSQEGERQDEENEGEEE